MILLFNPLVSHDGPMKAKDKSSNHKSKSDSLFTLHATLQVEQGWGKKRKMNEPRRQKIE